MAISTFEALTTRLGVELTNAHRVLTASVADLLASMSISRPTTWSYGASGADTVNQIATTIFTATKNTTTSLDLSGALTNVVGDSAATLTKIKWILIEYLTVAQDATNGTACAVPWSFSRADRTQLRRRRWERRKLTR